MLEAALVVAIIAALILVFSPIVRPDDTPGVLAGKPVASTGGGLVVPNGTFAGTTTATATVAGHWVHAKCSQGGTLVYEQWVKSDAARQAVLNLGPTPMWQSGSASCWAESGYWSSNGRWRQAASTNFTTSG